MINVRSPDPLSGEVARSRRVALVGASIAAWLAALGVALPLLGQPAIQPPLSAFNMLLLALVHLADEPGSILRWSRTVRLTLTALPLVAATLAGMWLAFRWPFDICSAAWPFPTDMAPTAACVGAVWLIAASRLAADRPEWTRLSAILGIAALPPAVTSLVGWVFGPTVVTSVATPLYLRVPAAIAVTALVAARMTSPLQDMPFRWLYSDRSTAVWLRRLMLTVLVLIPLLMLLQDHAVDHKWYQPHAAAMMSTVLMLTIGFTGILWSASKLNRAETLLRSAQAELEQRVADRTHELALANQALSRDITERRRVDEQLRASRERLRAVTESAIDPILTVDANGQIVQWNQAATQVFDYPESAILGARLELLLPELEDDLNSVSAFPVRIAGWLGQTRRCRGRRSSGTAIDLEVSCATWHDREDHFYSIIGRDVTARSRAEAELTDAKDAAEMANRSKSQFLANMSHEIRTPMNVILGMAELIANTELTDDQRRYLRSTREAGDHLLEIINDILDLSKVEAGALQLDETEFDIRELAEQTVEFLAPRAYSKHLEIVCHLDRALPPSVIADPQRLRQVLVNLLGNAVKFTDSGCVELFVDVAGADRLHLAVKDTGCGIAPEMHAVIFDSFTQVDASSTRRHGGTGLGLAISRQLVERMGGSLRVESSANSGSTFHINIPAQFDQRPSWSVARALEADPPLRDKLRQCRALVAGGHAVFRQSLRAQLAEVGATVTDVADCTAMLAELHAAEITRRPFALLVLDADVGGIDGYAAARRVVDAGLANPPRVAVTKPSKEPDDVQKRHQANVAVLVRKPVRPRALLDALAVMLGTRQEQEATTSERVDVLAAPPRTVLVVDDAGDNLRLMEAFLRETGWRVETADDGAQAVERWRAGQFDAILMDLQMPVMDGLAATREIRRLEVALGRAPTPIVAVTAHALDEARIQSLQAGCSAFLAKPLRRARLLNVLTEVFFGALHSPSGEDGMIEIVVDPLLLTLIPSFLAHRQEDVATVENALASGDFATIRMLGHSMKGSGGSYGFEVISRIGRELELAAREQDGGAIRQALTELVDYLSRVHVQ